MQAAGLCCVASTGVPKDACVSNKLRFLSLEQSADVWADTLLEMTASKTPIQYDGLEEWDIRHNVKAAGKNVRRGNGEHWLIMNGARKRK